MKQFLRRLFCRHAWINAVAWDYSIAEKRMIKKKYKFCYSCKNLGGYEPSTLVYFFNNSYNFFL